MKKALFLLILILNIGQLYCQNVSDSLIRIEIRNIENRVDEKLNSINEDIKKIKETKEKDTWDKISIVSGFLSSVIIALIGIYFTESYRRIQAKKEAALNEQELKVKEVETVEKFIPFLTGTEVQQEYAILAIQALGNTDLAIKLTKLYQSKGAVNALTKIENASSKEDRIKAQKALSEIFDSLKYSLVKIIASWKGKLQFSGNGFYVSNNGHIVTMNYVIQSHDKNILDIVVENYVGSKPKIERIIPSENFDNGLGIIYTDNSKSTPLTISHEKVGLNQKIFVSGFSDSKKSMFHYSGEVVGVMEDFYDIKANVGKYRELAGSPVFNNQGHLIGIISTYNSESKTFGVIKAQSIKEKVKGI